MNQQQKGILWIGVIVVLIFLFTDQSFRNQIFGHGVKTTAAMSTVPFSAQSIITSLTTVPTKGVTIA